MLELLVDSNKKEQPYPQYNFLGKTSVKLFKE